MGGGGKGGSTTTSSVQIPPEVLARYNAVNTQAQTVAQQPFQQYSTDPNAFVAPLTSTQQAGITNTNAMAGAAQPYYQAATSTLNQAYQNAQPPMGAAYQNIGQAQDVGNQYANAAAQQFGQAQGQAQPYYQNATAGLNAGLGMGNAMNAMGAASVAGAQGQAQPYYQNATQGTQAALQGAQPYQAGATAAALAGGQAVNAGGLDVNQYMNPYTQNVVNATQAALGQQFGQQMSDTQAQAILSGAFGGQRAGLQQAQLAGQQALAESQAISPLYAQNYNQALAAAQQQQGVGLGAAQANRAAQQQMSNQLSGIGQQGYAQGMGAANQMANLGQNLYNQGITSGQALSGIGQTGFGQNLAASQQNQALGQGLYNQSMGVGQAAQGLGNQQYNQGMGASTALGNLANQGFNMGNTTANSLAALGTNAQQAGLAGAQAQMAAGQTQQQTQQAGLQALYNQFQQQQSYPFQVAQFLANIAEGTGSLSGNTTTSTTTGGGGFFSSDKRLKENVQKVGKTNDGQPIYRFNYKGDPRTQIGLMAQDVEKSHPDAVGLAGGYKTVDYKKATQGAVRKADGGAATDNAYSMDAPSALLQDSGKGLGAMQPMALPQMVSGDDAVRNNAATFASRFGDTGANAADVAAMRAPSVAGQISDPSRAGYQAELDTLLNAPSNSNLGSGPGYVQSRANAIRGILGQNTDTYNSQGGLVAAPGDFARGGFAGGGYTDPMGAYYHNAALDYYGPQGTQNAGLGAIIAQGGGGARSLVPAQAPYRPPQRDAIAEANQMAGLVGNLNSAYKARPDFLRSAEDIKARAQTADAIKATELQKIQWAKDNGYDLNPTAATPASDAPATAPDMGSLADAPVPMPRPEGFASGGDVNPYSGGSFMDEILKQQAQAPQYHEMKGGEMPRQQPQQSGLGQLSQMASLGSGGKKVYDWAAKQLAGEASPAGVVGPTVGDSASVASGLGAATNTAATTGLSGLDASAFAIPDATAAGIDAGIAAAPVAETVAAAAPVAETVAAAAPVAEAATGIPAWLAFLGLPFGLKDGGAAQNRRHFDTDANVPVVNGDDEDQTTVVGKSNKLPKVPVLDNRPGPEDALVSSAPASTPKGGVAPSSSFSMPDFSGLVPEGAKDTLTSENFWVPALAGIGSMLASPNKTLLGAVGSGLVGGTTAYTSLEKQQNEMMAKRLEMMKGIFSGPYLMPDGKTPYWKMAGNPNPLTQEQYQEASSRYLGIPTSTGPASPAPVSSAARAPSSSTTELAKSVVDQPPPAISKPAALPSTTAQPAPAMAQLTAPQPVTSAQEPATSPVPSVTSVISGSGPTEAQMRAAVLAPGSHAFDGLPASQDPRILLPKIDALDKQINDASEFVKTATARGMMSPEIQQQMTQQEALATRLLKQRDDLSKAAEASVQSVIGIPVAAARRTAEINAENAAKIAALPAQKQAELKATLEARASTDPLDVKKATDTAIAEAQGKLPSEQVKYAFEQNYNRQMAAQKSAAGMADEGQQLLSQANAYMSAAFDKDGKPLISGGPMGKKLGALSQYLQQAGFSPEFARDLTGTDPNAIGAATKLQTTFASEMARMDLTKAPAVREFSNYMTTSPGPDLPAKTLQWLVNNVIKPKAESMKGAYTHVIDMDPGKDNIEKALYKYKDQNPWFKIGTPPPGAGTATTTTAMPQFTAAELAAEKQRRAAAQGVQ